MKNKEVYPYISFIIPAKNEEKNILRCISSILNINYPNNRFDILVIDNGSNDKTVEISKKSGASVYVCPNFTISKMRNYGANFAKGEYLAFIDADVSIDENWPNVCLRTVEKYNSQAVGSSPTIPENSTWIERAWHCQVRARDNVGKRPWIASMNLFVNRSVFLEVGGFDEALVTCEDVDLGYRISRKTDIIYNKDIIAIHYGEAKTVSHFFRKEYWRGIGSFESLLRNKTNFRELISFTSFLFVIISFCCLLFFVFYHNKYFIIFSSFFILLIPLLKTIRVSLRLREFRYFFQQIFVWILYDISRGLSYLVGIFKYIERGFMKARCF